MQTAGQHAGGKQSDQQACLQALQTKNGLYGVGDGTGLDQVAADKSGGDGTKRKPFCQQRGMESVSEIEHGTTLHAAIWIRLLIADGEKLFGVTCHHAKKGGDPHPE